MFAWIGIAFVLCLAAVGPVLKQKIKCPLREALVAMYGAVAPDAALAPDVSSVQLRLKRIDRFNPKIAPINIHYHPRLGFIHDKLAVFNVVAERYDAAHPDALLPGGGDLVAHSFSNQFPFELSEGQEDV